jgi:hypothetical protein
MSAYMSCHGPMVRTVQVPRGRNAEALRHWEGR